MFYNNFHLPRDFDAASNAGGLAVPSSTTVVTAGDTELAELSVTNTTSGNLTITLTNTAGVNIEDVVNVPPGAPTILIWNPPLRTLGLKWSASDVGLQGTVSGRKTTGWVLDASGYCTSTSA